MEFVIPDFVVVGATHPNGRVMLLASKTLTEAELRNEIEYPDRFDYRVRDLPPKVDVELIAKMKDYVEVWGDTYSEAWQTLFSRWSPRKGFELDYVAIDEEIKELPR